MFVYLIVAEPNATQEESDTELPSDVKEPVAKATRPQGRLVFKSFKLLIFR